jgi:holo-[acyl-carrier protein] synthase
VAVLGIGADVVDLGRFTAASRRTPGFVARVLSPGEQSDSPASMAARFAAKEALAKALGAPRGLRWHDAVVDTEPSGRPVFRVSGTVAEALAGIGARTVHLTLSHDAGIAVAMVVLES